MTSASPRSDIHDGQRDPHSGGRARAGATARRRCHPQLLGAEAHRQDRHHSGPDQSELAARPREPGHLSRANAREYCGFQHAHMSFEVIAESPRRRSSSGAQQQLQPARRTDRCRSTARAGSWSNIAAACAIRFAARTPARIAAPDLTHFASRRTIAAGLLPNNAGNLAGWIEDAASDQARRLMPNQYLSAQELARCARVPGDAAMKPPTCALPRSGRIQRRAPGAAAGALGDGAGGLAGFFGIGRSQADRHPLHRHGVRLPGPRRHRSAGDAAAAGRARICRC